MQLDYNQYRLIQTKQAKSKIFLKGQQDLCAVQVQDIQREFGQYIKQCAQKRIAITSIDEQKTLFLPYATRISPSYRKKVKNSLFGLNEVFHDFRFITLTTDPKLFSAKFNAEKQLSEMLLSIKRTWNKLRTSFARKYGKFSYLCVIEFTKSNLPHLHVIANVRGSKKDIEADISRLWAGHGQIYHVSKVIKRGFNAQNYVLKYVTKSIDTDTAALLWKFHIRTFSLSRDISRSSEFDEYEKISRGNYFFVGTVYTHDVVALCGLCFIECETVYNDVFEIDI